MTNSRIALVAFAMTCISSNAMAQTDEIQKQLKQQLATLKFAERLYDKQTGAFRPTQEGKPGLRATSAGVRAIVGFQVIDSELTSKYILSCYDEKTGGFAEPGEKPDVFTTSVGIMAAVELNIPQEKYKKSMEFLKLHVKDFEDIRIASAAIEAYGVKDSVIPVQDIITLAEFELTRAESGKDDPARLTASAVATIKRLGGELPKGDFAAIINKHQRTDGGWGKLDAKTSDLETTYRVMRAMWLMKSKPKDIPALRKFIESCQQKDGGYGVDAKSPSSIAGVYYVRSITTWLGKLEKQ